MNLSREGKLRDRRRLHYGHTRKSNVLYCDFCGSEDHWRLTPFKVYAPMLRIDLWMKIAGRRWREVMCLRCMLRKLGRPLNHTWDFRGPWWWHEKLPSERERLLRLRPLRQEALRKLPKMD